MIKNVPFLVNTTPLDQGPVAVDVGDRAAQRLAAVEDEQDPVLGGQRSRRSLTRARTTVAFSVEPSTTPSGTFVPSLVTPSAPTIV